MILVSVLNKRDNLIVAYNLFYNIRYNNLLYVTFQI